MSAVRNVAPRWKFMNELGQRRKKPTKTKEAARTKRRQKSTDFARLTIDVSPKSRVISPLLSNSPGDQSGRLLLLLRPLVLRRRRLLPLPLLLLLSPRVRRRQVQLLYLLLLATAILRLLHNWQEETRRRVRGSDSYVPCETTRCCCCCRGRGRHCRRCWVTNFAVCPHTQGRSGGSKLLCRGLCRG